MRHIISQVFFASALFAMSGIAGLPPVVRAQQVLIGVATDEANRVSMNQIDHQVWDQILKQFVDENGMVDYQGLKNSAAHVAALDRYITHLSTASLSTPANRENQLAFWINAYNAVTVHGILRHYPTTSIKNHVSRFGGFNIWKHTKLRIGGQQVSLDDMEHKVLRKMNEPRIHFAIVCASIGCPRLLNQAYTGKALNAQLSANAKNFFATPRNFQFDGRNFKLSKILSWFGGDFGTDTQSQLAAIAPYFPTQQAYDAATSGNARVSYLSYDWNLNQQVKRPVSTPSPSSQRGSGTKQGSGSR